MKSSVRLLKDPPLGARGHLQIAKSPVQCKETKLERADV